MRPQLLLPALAALALAALAACASSQRDFIPNGAGVNLPPTNPAHIEVLQSIPRGMVIGTVLVDRSKSRNTADIIQAAREKAASVGGDFIVWEDSLGTAPVATPSPAETGPGGPQPNTGALGHSAALVDSMPEQTVEKAPKARFTVGIYLPEARSR